MKCVGLGEYAYACNKGIGEAPWAAGLHCFPTAVPADLVDTASTRPFPFVLHHSQAMSGDSDGLVGLLAGEIRHCTQTSPRHGKRQRRQSMRRNDLLLLRCPLLAGSGMLCVELTRQQPALEALVAAAVFTEISGLVASADVCVLTDTDYLPLLMNRIKLLFCCFEPCSQEG